MGPRPICLITHALRRTHALSTSLRILHPRPGRPILPLASHQHAGAIWCAVSSPALNFSLTLMAQYLLELSKILGHKEQVRYRTPKPLKTPRVSTLDRTRVFAQGGPALRVGLYARVSTYDQKTLPMPLVAMRDYAKRRSWPSPSR